MSFRSMLTSPRTIRPASLFLAGGVAVVLICGLWRAGVDAGAMKMLLGAVLFALVVFGAYVVDPVGGRVSFRRGYLVGGLTMLVVLPWVVCRHSYQTRGVPLPNSAFEVAMLGVSLAFAVPFGAAVGAMTGVIGGLAWRGITSVAGIQGVKPGPKPPTGRPMDDPLEWRTG